jgi:sugar-specific transcriptional regulator TrmB
MLTDNIDIMEIRTTLAQLGLSGKRADIYLAALELGSATVLEIAKKAALKRTTCYDVLLDLQTKGYVFETIKGKKRLFLAEDPEKIQKMLRHKESLFSEILPQLKSIYNIKGVKPKIRFYEGKNGLREVYADTLLYSDEILCFASEHVVNVLGMDWAEDYLKMRVKKGIHVRNIAPDTGLTKRFVAQDQAQFRSSKLVSSQKYPFSIEINIYGHQKIALMSSKEETGIIIEGQEIHNTLKLIFELLWDTLPEIKLDKSLKGAP